MGNSERSRISEQALSVRSLGRVPYAEALEMQADLVSRRRAGDVPDTLLLLEHPHVITLGSGASKDNVLLGSEQRLDRGIEMYATGRGGDVTYHGPGQLVGYPILDLKPDRCDLHLYLRDLEQVLIDTIGDFGIQAGRIDGLTGVWVERRKLAAIGVRVSSGWITSHGFALNVNTELHYFDTIVPCGIRDHDVGSMAAELGRSLEMPAVEERIVENFRRRF